MSVKFNEERLVIMCDNCGEIECTQIQRFDNDENLSRADVNYLAASFADNLGWLVHDHLMYCGDCLEELDY